MVKNFAYNLKKIRSERGVSQQQLANLLFVDRSSIANWESGRRVPDAVIMSRLAQFFNVDISYFLSDEEIETPNVIIVDDEEIILSGTIPVLTEAMPNASITGFNRVSEVLQFAENNDIDIAFLDIELGKNSGIELCEKLLNIRPVTNVIFLTSYPGYSIDAWDTKASGFLVKPASLEDIQSQLKKLRHPVKGLY